MKKVTYLTLARAAAKIADEKKGEDIVVLNVRQLTTVADYFLIVTAASTPQMSAIIKDIQKSFSEEYHVKPVRREGKDTSLWSVLDYGGLVIHVMSPQTRHSYALENIWTEAKRIK